MSRPATVRTDLRGDSLVDSTAQEMKETALKVGYKATHAVVSAYTGPFAPTSKADDQLPGEGEQFQFLQHTVEANPMRAAGVMKDAALRRKEEKKAVSAGESRDDEEVTLSALEKVKIAGQALASGTKIAPKATPNASVATHDTRTINVVRGKTAADHGQSSDQGKS